MFRDLNFYFCLLVLHRISILLCQDFCLTPVGSVGEKINFSDCEPLKVLMKKDVKEISQNEYAFLQRSYLNINRTLVCCDQAMNVTKIFINIGTEILRNQAELCGDNTVKRISFGEETTFMSYPWTALLVYDTLQRFHCGGTLITNRYILTAAHCVKQAQFELIGVRLREHNTKTDRDCSIDDFGFEQCYQPVVDVGIEKTIAHQGFSLETMQHDIALLRLERVIKFERSIRPICLPEYQNQDFDLSTGIITGWGATSYTKHSDVLLAAVVTIQNLEQCRAKYTALKIDSLKICAASDDEMEGSAACKGDSGGPLILRVEGQASGRKFRYIQAGVITMGKENCSTTKSFPTLFTKVSAYMDWIAANIEL